MAGIAVGTLLAVVVARVLTGLLYGVSARDPITYAGAAVVLLMASAAACLVPAMRALRVDPVVALKVE